MENKKPPKGRRKYLSDFQRDLDGTYHYTGAHYLYAEDNRRSLPAALRVLWLCGLGAFGASVLSGCIPAAGAGSCFYVILPLVAELLAAVSILWALARLTAGGKRLRAYVYESAVEKLPIRSVVGAAAAGLGLLGEGLYLILHGLGERPLASLLYLALKLLCAGLCIRLRGCMKESSWQCESLPD